MLIKNGYNGGEQRCKCKVCSLNFVKGDKNKEGWFGGKKSAGSTAWERHLLAF
jgi:hypothetical protein